MTRKHLMLCIELRFQAKDDESQNLSMQRLTQRLKVPQKFLKELIIKTPVKIKSIQGDAKFMNEFEEDYKNYKVFSMFYLLLAQKMAALKEVTKLLERNSMKVLHYWLILLDL